MWHKRACLPSVSLLCSDILAMLTFPVSVYCVGMEVEPSNMDVLGDIPPTSHAPDLGFLRQGLTV